MVNMTNKNNNTYKNHELFWKAQKPPCLVSSPFSEAWLYVKQWKRILLSRIHSMYSTATWRHITHFGCLSLHVYLHHRSLWAVESSQHRLLKVETVNKWNAAFHRKRFFDWKAIKKNNTTKKNKLVCSHRGHLKGIVGATMVQVMAQTGDKES